MYFFCVSKVVLYFSSTAILDEIAFRTLNTRLCSSIKGKYIINHWLKRFNY